MTKTAAIDSLLSLFESTYGPVSQVQRIDNGGSPRKYFRIFGQDGFSAIGVINDDVKENECFFSLDDMLRKNGVNVPEFLSVSEDKKSYLLEDLGDVSLFSLLGGAERMALARQALQDLLSIQFIPQELWIDKVGFKPFSSRLVFWDLNYFKYDFLKPSGIIFDEERLEDDFHRLADLLINKENIEGLMYRDFQSRNIMVKDGKLWFIDFQGARKGPVLYDAVSFIWQAKAPFTYEEREELNEFYLSLLLKRGYDEEILKSQLEGMLVFRNLQVLGAYGFRGLIEGKKHFIDSLPFAVANLQYHKEKGRVEAFPELKRISEILIVKYLTGGSVSSAKSNVEEGLTLTVTSFSYKKGYPEDKSGNGGGFMFDCRAIHNPGRYEEYKQLTGRDAPVKEFLEKTDEASSFVDNALRIVSPSVKRYLDRGFTSLQVGFGCTGGQHRSVYCAERFAKLISDRFPEIKVNLIHREQSL